MFGLLRAVATASLLALALAPGAATAQTAAQTAAQPAAQGPSGLGPPAAMAEPRGGYVGRMRLLPESGPGGSPVEMNASGLPPGEEFDLVWRTMHGVWKAENGAYNGRGYQPAAYRIARLRSDERGEARARFIAPDDFGFGHDVVIQQGERLFTQANFNIEMSMELNPPRGPLGTLIEVTVKGVGWRQLENSWTLVYDNAFTGFLSSVTTQGTARFTIPATGHAGDHMLSLIHGEFTFPYLNPEQNPRPDRPRFTRRFTLTPGAPVLPPPPQTQRLESVKFLPPAGQFVVSPSFGPVETPVNLEAEGLAPGEDYAVIWTTMVGNRVGGGGFGEDERQIGRVRADAQGRVKWSFKAPDDLGGAHSIILKSAREERRGVFTIMPSALPLDVSEGPAGTEFRIRLRGVGWTETANIYALVYDNVYSGYACGFNSQGHVDIIMKATGAAGHHFIDLYPAIYKGNETRPNNFRIPQLTWADDHPGEDLPRFRFVFNVTETAASLGQR